MSFKCTVLTFIFGKGYERVHEIQQKNDDIEYILVTDDDELKSSTWNVVVDHSYDTLSGFEKCFKVRYNPFKYSHAPICMTIDGSIQLNKFPYALLDKFNSDHYEICLMPHPIWSDFYSEYNAWMRMRNYPVDQAQRAIKFFNDKKYDFNYQGLFQLCFSMKRNNELTQEIDDIAFSTLKELSGDGPFERLDQTVYSYVMNTQFSSLKVLPVSEQIVRSDYMTWYWHNSDKKNLNFFMIPGQPDYKNMFNKKVECFQLYGI